MTSVFGGFGMGGAVVSPRRHLLGLPCAVLEESVAKNALDIPWVTVAILWNTGVLVYRGVGGGRLFASAWTEPFGNRRCRRAWTQQM